ncbi:MAG TPA: hypothetical protein VK623_05690 [Flavobacterium sp.]|nr:hypothetical protein [Flavobacterium sp.]
MENTSNWNAQNSDQQNDWQEAENDYQEMADANEDEVLDFTTEGSYSEDADEVLYAGGGGHGEDDGEDDDKDEDDKDEDDNDNDDDDLEDWGNIDPLSNPMGLPDDMDPSGPGSAV